METRSTKERILCAAVKLFSENGYEKVTMRAIADMAGIKAASIYNHFPSKIDILRRSYAFYAEQQRMATPARESLLRLAETEPVQDVLGKLDYRWPPAFEETLDLILSIATHRIGLDDDSHWFIRKRFFEFHESLWIPVLERLIELKKIEPIDVDSFACVLTYFSFTAAALNKSVLGKSALRETTPEQWNRCLGMVLSLLKPIPPEGG